MALLACGLCCLLCQVVCGVVLGQCAELAGCGTVAGWGSRPCQATATAQWFLLCTMLCYAILRCAA
jgi:hypothetical protein